MILCVCVFFFCMPDKTDVFCIVLFGRTEMNWYKIFSVDNFQIFNLTSLLQSSAARIVKASTRKKKPNQFKYALYKIELSVTCASFQ